MQSIANLTLDSREVATMVDKQHCHLVRDIAKYVDVLMTESKNGLSDFFKNSTYKDSSGKVNKCYLLTRKGCEFVANKMTGRKGILFTANYINRFHEMEKELLTKPKKKPDYDNIYYHNISSNLNSTITNAVRSTEEADACLSAILGIISREHIAPVRCLVKEYGRLVHQSEECESRAVDECGRTNYERYRTECKEIRDFCVRNEKDFTNALNK